MASCVFCLFLAPGICSSAICFSSPCHCFWSSLVLFVNFGPNLIFVWFLENIKIYGFCLWLSFNQIRAPPSFKETHQLPLSFPLRHPPPPPPPSSSSNNNKCVYSVFSAALTCSWQQQQQQQQQQQGGETWSAKGKKEAAGKKEGGRAELWPKRRGESRR